MLLTDKPDGRGGRAIWPDWSQLSSSALRARADLDQPLDAVYVREITARSSSLQSQSRWLNAVSVIVTPEQELEIRNLHFVRRIRPVGRLHGVPEPPAESAEDTRLESSKPGGAAQADYGPSFEQLSRTGVTLLHSMDIRGAGVRVGLLDSGFNYGDHAAFSQLRIVAERDFINADDDVSDEMSEPVTGNELDVGQNEHGTRVLSILGGNAPGRLIGAAPEAEYILAKTEDLKRELSADEDRWVAGLEWLVGEGAQVVNSSVGFTVFDDSSGYAIDDLDGSTSMATIAAEIAVARGVVVVVSAGNEGAGSWRYITVPADAAGAITVGSVSLSSSVIAPFSSRGPTADGRIKPDVVAPGQDVITTTGRSASRSGEQRGTFELDEYGRVSGTSFAAPLVSGVCALLKQAHPSWGPAQIAEALRMTATDLGVSGPDTTYGWGLVDAAAASGLSFETPDVSVALAPFPNPLEFDASETGATIFFPLELSDRDDVSVHIYDLAGNLIDTVGEVRLESGSYLSRQRALPWEPPRHIAAGLYYYQIEATTVRERGKLAIIRP